MSWCNALFVPTTVDTVVYHLMHLYAHMTTDTAEIKMHFSPSYNFMATKNDVYTCRDNKFFDHMLTSSVLV